MPEPLRKWIPWALWEKAGSLAAPPIFNHPQERWGLWTSGLTLVARNDGADFTLQVRNFQAGWVGLPGGSQPGQVWPQSVRVEKEAGMGIAPLAGVPPSQRTDSAVVLEREGRPVVWLGAGSWKVTGRLVWAGLPEWVLVPADAGILRVEVLGRELTLPMLDGEGKLWLLQEPPAELAAENFLGLKAYGLLEDGSPLWLRLELELTVAGETRGENLGRVLPEGWRLAAVESPIPFVLDPSGEALARVKPGRWVVRVSAFRSDNPQELLFPAGAKFSDWLVGWRAKPDFRSVEIEGGIAVDAQQTTYPEPWRDGPVYRWEKGATLRLVERLRGPGEGAAAGLAISRDWWLGEDGRELIFRDEIQGTAQRLWRLDAAPGQEPGAVRENGAGLLLTRNPLTGLPGVEIRQPDFQLQATGTMKRSAKLAASGWQANADSLEIRLHLPPGWRALALWGPDQVEGEWITQWSLLDLFLVLVFVLAVFRLYGLGAAVLALLALVLSYHEPGAPRFAWLALLAPLALLGLVQHARVRLWLRAWKWVSALVLLAVLVPFLARQVQQTLFPQLEFPGRGGSSLWGGADGAAEPVSSGESGRLRRQVMPPMAAPAEMALADAVREYSSAWGGKVAPAAENEVNLAFDPKARIQTGPGIPNWSWRTVFLRWSGPLGPEATLEPVLIPPGVERILGVLRVLLGVALAGWLLRVPVRLRSEPSAGGGGGWSAATAALLVGALLLAAGSAARAESFPPPELLQTLQDRLLEPGEAFPQAAEIPLAKLTVAGRQLTAELEVHTVAVVAVPLPGRLPDWSPVRIEVSGEALPALRRHDGFIWVALPPGVHRVRLQGLLPEVSEWAWSYVLRPKRVEVSAPGWTVSGLRPDGVPESQLLLVRERAEEAPGDVETNFDRQPWENLVQVRRTLELGLQWRVRTEVLRLTPTGRAFALRLPLLPGENLLTGQLQTGMESGQRWVEVNFAAGHQQLAWEGELPQTPAITLQAAKTSAWVEFWQVRVSPVWNLRLAGLPPVFSSNTSELLPTWFPWPGEEVQLSLERPEALPGATLTVDRVSYAVSPGPRQSLGRLEGHLRASLADTLAVNLPAGVEVTEVRVAGELLPVRMEEQALLLPIRPGEQDWQVGWRLSEGLGLRTAAPPVKLSAAPTNVDVQMEVPADRWVLWTTGPLRGPAVRFWTVLAAALLAAGVLARVRNSPLRFWEWVLLALGLTQASLPVAGLIVAWLFLLAWRGQSSFQSLPRWAYNLLQILLILASPLALLALLWVVAAGLLGDPQMFITGWGSTPQRLNWFVSPGAAELPAVTFYSVSLWWYRLAMLLWALWLAIAVLRWLQIGWRNLLSGGFWRPAAAKPPKLPTAGA